MRIFNVFASKKKFVFAIAFFCVAVLSHVGDVSAKEPDTVVHMCVCHGSCRLVKMCLANYCYTETVCDECANCHRSRVRASAREGSKVCLYRKGTACVTNVTTRRRG